MVSGWVNTGGAKRPQRAWRKWSGERPLPRLKSKRQLSELPPRIAAGFLGSLPHTSGSRHHSPVAANQQLPATGQEPAPGCRWKSSVESNLPARSSRRHVARCHLRCRHAGGGSPDHCRDTAPRAARGSDRSQPLSADHRRDTSNRARRQPSAGLRPPWRSAPARVLLRALRFARSGRKHGWLLASRRLCEACTLNHDAENRIVPAPAPFNPTPAELIALAQRVMQAARFPQLATIDGDQPRVRPVSPVRVEGFTVYVANLRRYGKTREIALNP